VDTPESLPSLLERMEATLRTMQAVEPIKSRVDRTNRFMAYLYELGLLLLRCPQLDHSAELQTFLQSTAPLLRAIIFDVERFIDSMEDEMYSSWEISPWIGISRDRSSLEFLRKLYKDTQFGEFLCNFDLSKVDDLLRRRGNDGGYLSDAEIPSGIPAAHWWWWYPNEPRSV
jgi:hypothetical protein